MAELAPSDVETYTGGRLLASGTETQRMLDAALVAARRFTEWPVSPVRLADTVMVDGPCSRALHLPTRNLLDLTAVTEDGTVLDLAKLTWSVHGWVRKDSGAYWSCKYQSITVTMDHGYTEAEAADWRQAILAMVDQMSQIKSSPSGGPSAQNLVEKQVDNVRYKWQLDAEVAQAAEQALFSVTNILESYRLVPVYLV